MLIRNATLADAPRLLEIYGWYVENTAVSFEIEVPTAAAFEQRIREYSRRYPYLVMEEAGVVCGYAYAGPFRERAAYDCSAQASIYLDRFCRRKGYGRALYNALIPLLKQQGITNLYAMVASSKAEDEYLTHGSRDFHRRMGFVQVGECHDCARKFGRRYNLLTMEKIIGE